MYVVKFSVNASLSSPPPMSSSSSPPYFFPYFFPALHIVSHAPLLHLLPLHHTPFLHLPLHHTPFLHLPLHHTPFLHLPLHHTLLLLLPPPISFPMRCRFPCPPPLPKEKRYKHNMFVQLQLKNIPITIPIPSKPASNPLNSHLFIPLNTLSASALLFCSMYFSKSCITSKD